MTFVEKGVNFDGGEVFLWVSTANFGQDVCVCVCERGRASCRERVWISVVAAALQEKKMVDSQGKMRCATCVERSIQLCLA